MFPCKSRKIKTLCRSHFPSHVLINVRNSSRTMGALSQFLFLNHYNTTLCVLAIIKEYQQLPPILVKSIEHRFQLHQMQSGTSNTNKPSKMAYYHFKITFGSMCYVMMNCKVSNFISKHKKCIIIVKVVPHKD